MSRNVGFSIEDQVEAILFVAETPATAESIANAIGCPIFEVEDALEEIDRRYRQEGPLQLVRLAGGYQLSTKPAIAPVVARFVDPQPSRMSRSLLEVLAVVAYRQPITGPEVEAVRGVDSSYALGQLKDRKLVKELGRKQTPGRPMLYGTTPQFLHMFNLDKLDDLPPLSDTKALESPAQPALVEYTEESP